MESLKVQKVCCENCKNFAEVKILFEKSYSNELLCEIENALETLKETDKTNHLQFYRSALYITINFLLKELSEKSTNEVAVEALKKYISKEIELNHCKNDPVKKLKKDLQVNGYTKFPSDYKLYNKDNFSINSPNSLWQCFFVLWFLPRNVDQSNKNKPNERTSLLTTIGNRGE